MDVTKINKTVVVTGANKGIGYGIVKSLLTSSKSQNTRVVLTSRNTELGLKTVNGLLKDCASFNAAERLVYQQLDINDTKSQENFCDWVAKTYGTIDILVNNAGVSDNSDKFDADVFDFTFSTNFYETVKFTERMIKLITEKVVFISSSASQYLEFGKSEIKAKFLKENITAEELMKLSKEFRNAIESKTYKQTGWPDNCYGMSKLFLSLWIRYFAKTKEVTDRNVQVYGCCPGWVKTDMGGQNAHKTLEEGMVTPMYLIELEGSKIQNDLQGQFFENCKVSSPLK